MDILLIGFGTVGQGFVELLRDRHSRLQNQHQLTPRIVGVATGSRGILHHPHGLDPAALLATISNGSLHDYPATDNLHRDFDDALALIRAVDADVMIEATPSNLETAEPALSYCRAAFDTGKHVILANKGPVALAYDALQALARQQQRHLLYEGTVMAGTPAIRTANEALQGCEITRIEGILNGTTNFMLSQMEDGLSYNQALSNAQQLGYAESDPTADVDGWDAASKILILMAAIFSTQVPLDDLAVQGIRDLTAEQITAATANNERYKLVAFATPDGGGVRPMRLSNTHPLASVDGVTNAITYTTDLLGDVTIVGAGAGRQETGFALLADLLALHRMT